MMTADPDKMPRFLIEQYQRYVIHKVASVEVVDDIMRFTFVDQDGREYPGIRYASDYNGGKPDVHRMLKASGLERVEDVRYVVVYVSACVPWGHPHQLLKDFPCKWTDDLTASLLKDRSVYRWQCTTNNAKDDKPKGDKL